MIFGVRVQGDDFAGLRQLVGPATLGRVFASGRRWDARRVGPQEFVRRLVAAGVPVRRAGMVPFVSCKPEPDQVIAGWFDRHFTAWGRYIKAEGLPWWWTVWHEPENDEFGGPTFVQAYTRAYQVVRRYAGELVTIGPVHQGYQWRPSMEATRQPAQWRVPVDARDFVGLDVYASNWSGPHRSIDEQPDWQRWYKYIGHAGPIVIAERGIAQSPRQAETLRRDLDYLKDLDATVTPVSAYCYWHSDGAPDDSVYLLQDDTARVLREAILAQARPRPGA